MSRTEEAVTIKVRHEGASRSLEAEARIDAPVEAVWKALTDAEELTHWFPFKSRVEPGVGGSIWLGWESGGFEGAIEAWEPERHLRATWPAGHPAEHDVPVVVDYYLQGHGGETTLRLVHSGFSADTEWDDEFDAHRRGWSFELRSLQHYLQCHRGRRRHLAKVRHVLPVPQAEAWSRLMSERGLLREGSLAGLAEGDRYDVTMATGDRLTGEVRLLIAPTDLAVTVEGGVGSFLRLSLHECGGPVEMNLWLAAYGSPAKELQELEERWQKMANDLFPESRADEKIAA